MKVWENIWETPFERKGTCIQIIFIIFHVLYAFWLQLFLADHPKKTNTLLSWEQIVALSRFQKKKILDQFFIHPQIVELRPCLLLSVMKRCTCIIWGILANQTCGGHWTCRDCSLHSVWILLCLLKLAWLTLAMLTQLFVQAQLHAVCLKKLPVQKIELGIGPFHAYCLPGGASFTTQLWYNLWIIQHQLQVWFAGELEQVH